MLPKNSFFSITIILLLFFSAFYSLNDALNSVTLYVALPVAFLMSFMQELKIKSNAYMGILLLLYLWVLFTTFFSVDVGISLLELKRILGCVILCYIVSVQAKRQENIPWLYMVFVILYIAALDYAYNNIISMMGELGGKERVNDDRLNANTLAYYTFFITFVIFILGEIINNTYFKKIIKLSFFITIPLSFWIAIITASRQVLILQLPLICCLLWLRYIKYGKTINRLLFIILASILVIYCADFVIDQYESSYLAKRSAVAVEDDNRFILVKESLMLGLNNLFVGVGPGCVRLFTWEGTFSHNTFLELFAGTGIMGMIIYLVLLWKYLKTQIKRYKKTGDKMFMYFIIFGCFFLLDQMFYVFHASLWLIGFFILVASHSDVYYENKYNKVIETGF